MKFISWILYVPLQLIALPICIFGMLLISYRQMLVSKRLGVSQTAIEVFNARWTLHIFGMRKDPGAVKLGSVLPNTSTLGLWLALFPLWCKAKIAGEAEIYPRRVNPGFETVMDLFTARTFYFDHIITRHIPLVRQFVMLGAGMDTRPYGTLNINNLNVFEIDLATTQRLKIESLSKAKLATDHVTFVPMDFARDALFERLGAGRYDRHQKTLFLWEGVTLYLPEATIHQTLVKVFNQSVAGSALVADFYSDRLVTKMKSRLGHKLLQYTQEAAQFSLNFDEAWEQKLRAFVQSTGFTLGETYFMGNQSPHGPFMVVAELVA